MVSFLNHGSRLLKLLLGNQAEAELRDLKYGVGGKKEKERNPGIGGGKDMGDTSS